jgi:hypothetical protein
VEKAREIWERYQILSGGCLGILQTFLLLLGSCDCLLLLFLLSKGLGWYYVIYSCKEGRELRAPCVRSSNEARGWEDGLRGNGVVCGTAPMSSLYYDFSP